MPRTSTNLSLAPFLCAQEMVCTVCLSPCWPREQGKRHQYVCLEGVQEGRGLLHAMKGFVPTTWREIGWHSRQTNIHTLWSVTRGASRVRCMGEGGESLLHTTSWGRVRWFCSTWTNIHQGRLFAWSSLETLKMLGGGSSCFLKP